MDSSGSWELPEELRMMRDTIRPIVEEVTVRGVRVCVCACVRTGGRVRA